MKSQDRKRLLTAKQVAAQCGVTVRSVAKWNSEGRLVAHWKLPGRTGALLFDPEEVARFQAERDQQ